MSRTGSPQKSAETSRVQPAQVAAILLSVGRTRLMEDFLTRAEQMGFEVEEADARTVVLVQERTGRVVTLLVERATEWIRAEEGRQRTVSRSRISARR